MSEPLLTRLVPVRILTPLGWVPCAFTIPRLTTFSDWLDHQGPFLRPSSARIPGGDGHVTSFVLQRDAAMLVVPDDPADAVRGEIVGAERVEHEVAFMLEVGVIRGRLETLAHVSLGDWLMHHPGFVLLKEVTVSLAGAPRSSGIQRHPGVLVNAARVIGVIESPASRPPARPMKALPAPARKPRK
jgi:hypothetical protein